jgi:hypothetical protein
MPKRNSDNLRIKRKYLVWLKDARGLSDATVAKAAASISTYEAFLNCKDLRGFHPERARAFKRHLTGTGRRGRDKPLSPGTVNGILRDLTAFLNWLADQPGYKSKIQRADIAYLSPDRKSETARRTSCWKPHPSPAQVRALLSQMADGTELERRDRALVAFLFLTGSRETAAISLSLVKSILNTDSSSSTVGTWRPNSARASRPRSSRSVNLWNPSFGNGCKSCETSISSRPLIPSFRERRSAADQTGVSPSLVSTVRPGPRRRLPPVSSRTRFAMPDCHLSRHTVSGTLWPSSHASTAARLRTTRPGRRTWGTKMS